MQILKLEKERRRKKVLAKADADLQAVQDNSAIEKKKKCILQGDKDRTKESGKMKFL